MGLSIWTKPRLSNPYTVATWFKFKFKLIDRIYSLKYLKSITLVCKDKGIMKSDLIPFNLMYKYED